MQYSNDPSPQNCCTQFDERVRENPSRAILTAFGVGIAAALLLRALRPQPDPRSHARQLLEDIRDRLHNLADPALDRLHELAGEGSGAIKKGACRAEGMARHLRSLGGKVGSLFH